MKYFKLTKSLGAWTVAAILLAPTVAASQDTKAAEAAAQARQNFMALVSYQARPLYGMAKDPSTYDAAVAAKAAEELRTLVSWDYMGAYLEGSSKADIPGKTRALPAAWENSEKREQDFAQLRAAVDEVVAQAGNGPEAFGTAVGEMGKICGACHNDFRAKEF